MVNYCYIQGCGRNSRSHNHLNFYSFPKEHERQLEWAKAIGREDLLLKDSASLGEVLRFNRICSRHFAPSAVRRKKGLMPDAAPTLCLPGSTGGDEEMPCPEQVHADIFCNNCSGAVVGFRYKCVTCEDFDLCQNCEMTEVHSEHYMLRIPVPKKFKLADNLTKKWREYFKSEHATAEEECSSGDSSDDEPITKYRSQEPELAEDVKARIRKEIRRVLNMRPEEKLKKAQEREPKKRKMEERSKERDGTMQKRMKTEQNECFDVPVIQAPELAFADVNEEIRDTQSVDMKPEFSEFMPVISSVGSVTEAEVPVPFTSTEPLQPTLPTSLNQLPDHSIPPAVLVTPIIDDTPAMISESVMSEGSMQAVDNRPVMHVKLSDDLQQLMIEVTSQNQKVLYKYN